MPAPLATVRALDAYWSIPAAVAKSHAQPCHDGAGRFASCGTPNPHRRAHGRWRHQDRRRKVRGAEHADLIADAAKDRKATARDLKRERRALRKDQRKERRSLNRDGKRQVAKLEARHAREAAGSRSPARTAERHRDERGELASTLREDRAAQRDEHADQRSTLRQDHRDRVHDELESAREVHYLHRRDQLHDSREARGEAPEGDMPGGKSFAAKARPADALDRLQHVADRLLKAVGGSGETAENLGNIGESWANTLGWKGARKPKPPKGKPGGKPGAKPGSKPCHDTVGQFTACGTAGGAGPKKPKPPKAAKPKPSPKKPPKSAPKKRPAKVPPKVVPKPKPPKEEPTSRPPGGHAAAPYKAEDDAPFAMKPGEKLTVARDRYADRQERIVARRLDAVWLKDNGPYDVIARRKTGKEDAVEVKTLHYGDTSRLSVHPGAWYDKVMDAQAHPDRQYHTVVLDKRNESEGGVHKDKYAGSPYYYRRAAGPYNLSEMHPCGSVAEVDRLMKMTDAELAAVAPKALGKFPSGEELEALKARAVGDRQMNNERSKRRKALLGRAAYGKGGPWASTWN